MGRPRPLRRGTSRFPAAFHWRFASRRSASKAQQAGQNHQQNPHHQHRRGSPRGAEIAHHQAGPRQGGQHLPFHILGSEKGFRLFPFPVPPGDEAALHRAHQAPELPVPAQDGVPHLVIARGHSQGQVPLMERRRHGIARHRPEGHLPQGHLRMVEHLPFHRQPHAGPQHQAEDHPDDPAQHFNRSHALSPFFPKRFPAAAP